VEVVSKDGSKILPPKEIKQQLEKVVEIAGGKPSGTVMQPLCMLARNSTSRLGLATVTH